MSQPQSNQQQVENGEGDFLLLGNQQEDDDFENQHLQEEDINQNQNQQPQEDVSMYYELGSNNNNINLTSGMMNTDDAKSNRTDLSVSMPARGNSPDASFSSQHRQRQQNNNNNRQQQQHAKTSNNHNNNIANFERCGLFRNTKFAAARTEKEKTLLVFLYIARFNAEVFSTTATAAFSYNALMSELQSKLVGMPAFKTVEEVHTIISKLAEDNLLSNHLFATTHQKSLFSLVRFDELIKHGHQDSPTISINPRCRALINYTQGTPRATALISLLPMNVRTFFSWKAICDVTDYLDAKLHSGAVHPSSKPTLTRVDFYSSNENNNDDDASNNKNNNNFSNAAFDLQNWSETIQTLPPQPSTPADAEKMKRVLSLLKPPPKNNNNNNGVLSIMDATLSKNLIPVFGEAEAIRMLQLLIRAGAIVRYRLSNGYPARDCMMIALPNTPFPEQYLKPYWESAGFFISRDHMMLDLRRILGNRGALTRGELMLCLADFGWVNRGVNCSLLSGLVASNKIFQVENPLASPSNANTEGRKFFTSDDGFLFSFSSALSTQVKNQMMMQQQVQFLQQLQQQRANPNNNNNNNNNNFLAGQNVLRNNNNNNNLPKALLHVLPSNDSLYQQQQQQQPMLAQVTAPPTGSLTSATNHYFQDLIKLLPPSVPMDKTLILQLMGHQFGWQDQNMQNQFLAELVAKQYIKFSANPMNQSLVQVTLLRTQQQQATQNQQQQQVHQEAAQAQNVSFQMLQQTPQQQFLQQQQFHQPKITTSMMSSASTMSIPPQQLQNQFQQQGPSPSPSQPPQYQNSSTSVFVPLQQQQQQQQSQPATTDASSKTISSIPEFIMNWAKKLVAGSALASRLATATEKAYLTESLCCIARLNRINGGEAIQNFKVRQFALENWMKKSYNPSLRNAKEDELSRIYVQCMLANNFLFRSRVDGEFVVELNRDFVKSVRDSTLLLFCDVNLRPGGRNDDQNNKEDDYSDDDEDRAKVVQNYNNNSAGVARRQRFYDAILSAQSSSRLNEKERKFLVAFIEILIEIARLRPGVSVIGRAMRKSSLMQWFTESKYIIKYMDFEDKNERIGMYEFLVREHFLFESMDPKAGKNEGGNGLQVELHRKFVKEIQKQHLLIVPTHEELLSTNRTENNNNDADRRRQRSRTPPSATKKAQQQQIQNQQQQPPAVIQQQQFVPLQSQQQQQQPIYVPQQFQPPTIIQQPQQQQQQQIPSSAPPPSARCLLIPPPLCVFQGRVFYRPLGSQLLYAPPPIIIQPHPSYY